jgi:cell division protein FtsQ
MSQLNFDLSLLAINLNEVKQKMEKHPWVRSVHVEKNFPHTLSIRAEKEEPRAIVAADKLYYINRWGKIFKEVDVGEKLDYPIITGVPVHGEGNEKDLNLAVLALSTVEAEGGRWSLENLSELHMKGDGSVYLYYSSLPIAIKVRASDLGSRMADLKRVIEHLNRTGRIRMAREINLDYADGAVVSFRKG